MRRYKREKGAVLGCYELMCVTQLVTAKTQKNGQTTKEQVKQWSKNLPLTQFHYTCWPEEGLPSSASLIEFINLLQAHSSQSHPIIVLCK